MVIDANGLHFQALNRQIRETADAQIVIEHCCGQRYIASGLSGKTIDIHGIPGNALGAYPDSGRIFVHGNAQDAVGDTMNDGEICIDGMAAERSTIFPPCIPMPQKLPTGARPAGVCSPSTTMVPPA